MRPASVGLHKTAPEICRNLFLAPWARPRSAAGRRPDPWRPPFPPHRRAAGLAPCSRGGAHGAPDGARPRLRKPQRARQRLTDPLGKGTKLLKMSTGGTIFCKIPWHKIVPGASETAGCRATSRNNITQPDECRPEEQFFAAFFEEKLLPSPWNRLAGGRQAGTNLCKPTLRLSLLPRSGC